MNKKVLLILVLAFFQFANAQTSIFFGTGIVAYKEPGDGFVFSSEFQMPIGKPFSISTNFSMMKSFNSANITQKWDNVNGNTVENFVGDDDLDQSINLYLFADIKPFSFFKSDKLSKIDFKLGVGYGVTYTTSFSYYFDNGGIQAYTNKYRTINSFVPRASYTYHYNKRLLFGMVIGYAYYTVDPLAYLNFQVGIAL